MTLPRRRRGQREDRAREVLDRAVAVLRQRQRDGTATAPVAEMLALLGADPENAPAPMTQYRDPRADPLTGARWAGAPGSAPPGS